MKESKELLARYVREAVGGGVQKSTLDLMVDMVRSDTPEGFHVFYETTRNRPLPSHAVKDWVPTLYGLREHTQHVRLINESFRGSTKSATFTEAFTAYQMGLHPHRSNLFVQASDDSAEMAAGNVADTITKNPMWKLYFPTVVPDEDKGWGQKGRWIQDKADSGFAQKRDRNPSLIGASFNAAIVVGKHPTGVFILDDINDDKNTESDRLNQAVNRVLTDTLFPMLEDTQWGIFNQTPWSRKDALALVKDTGVWHHMFTPVMRPCAESTPGAQFVMIEKDGNVLYSTWAILTWPEKFGPDVIAKKYKEQGAKGFARMYLLDLTAMEGIHLKREWLNYYPHMEIDPNWPVYAGMDYASTADMVKGKDPDYTAIAISCVHPSGNRILLDGYRGRLTQGEAELKLKAIAMTYPQLEGIGLELEGTGKEFYNTMIRYSDLPMIPMTTKGRSKGYRFERVMGPHFEFGRVWMSDRRTSFGEAFVDEFVNYPEGEHDDTLDAVYYSLASTGLFYEETQPAFYKPHRAWYDPEPQRASPFASWGRR